MAHDLPDTRLKRVLGEMVDQKTGATSRPLAAGSFDSDTLRMRPLPPLGAALTVTLAACASFLEPIPSSSFTRPVLVSNALRFTDISAGGLHACAVTATGDVYCWGKSEYGELGTAATLDPCGGPGPLGFTCTGTPRRVEGLPPIASIAVSMGGGGRSCGLAAEGAAWCWGYGLGGQLGNGTRASSATPVAVAGGRSFTSLSVGSIATCGIATDGETYCWGPNPRLYGDGTIDGLDVPRRVTADSLRFASVHVFDTHACGLTALGRAYCWGSNWSGSLGVGSAGGSGGVATSATPVAVVGDLTFASLSTGGSHSCGQTTGGETFCWGSSTLVASPDAYVSTPTRVAPPVPFASLYSGYSHACGLTATNEVYCWGENYGGVLGDGTETLRRTPTRVRSSVPLVRVSRFPTCALSADGAAYCWGDNTFGQVGRRPGSGS